jgi:hypothetical protein
MSLETLGKTVKRLAEQGLFKSSPDPDQDAIKQTKQFCDLVARAEKSDLRRKFLCHYDATLRLVELVLLQYDYLLDQQPHATARKIISAIEPSFNFYELSQVRHDAKKAGVEPSENDLDELMAVQRCLEDVVNPRT